MKGIPHEGRPLSVAGINVLVEETRAIQAGGKPPLLTVRGVSTYYGSVAALKGVDLDVGEGEIVTLIGANGAGKSTLMMTIFGAPQAREGTITYDGRDITRLPTHEIARLAIAQSPEGRRVFPRMSVHENLQMGAALHGGRFFAEDLEKVVTLFPRVGERLHQRAGTMSGGEQQMLAMGRALMARPKVLLLDEPSMGLSPIMVDKIFEVVQTVHGQGVTVLLVEQNASRALQIADRGYVMESGVVTMSGDARTMLDDPKVRAAYLGE